MFDGHAVGDWDPCEKDEWWRTHDWLRAVSAVQILAGDPCVSTVGRAISPRVMLRLASTPTRQHRQAACGHSHPDVGGCSVTHLVALVHRTHPVYSSGTDCRGDRHDSVAIDLHPGIASASAGGVQRCDCNGDVRAAASSNSNGNVQPVAATKKRTRSRTFWRRTHRRWRRVRHIRGRRFRRVLRRQRKWQLHPSARTATSADARPSAHTEPRQQQPQ